MIGEEIYKDFLRALAAELVSRIELAPEIQDEFRKAVISEVSRRVKEEVEKYFQAEEWEE